MNLKFADPFVSEFEKNKIREMLAFQQRNLEAAQAELRDALDRLSAPMHNRSFNAPTVPPS